MDRELFGFKKKKTSDPSLEGEAFTFEERAELFEDLLEEDQSQFPLLEAPHEVLAAIGACLDAGHLAALSELCAQAHGHLDEAFADAWTALLLRDHMPRSRAKRYRAYTAATGDAQRAIHHSAGLVLAVVDLSRIEWDGLLVAAPAHLRYRFLQTMGALKNRWGRLAQSWEWFVTRVMHRTTYEQLERFVPSYRRPVGREEAADNPFDEVSYQASMDRALRQRHSECNPQDVIASMKRRLGLADGSATEAVGGAVVAAEETGKSASDGAAGGGTDDVLSAMAPTARDQRLHQAERAAAAAAAAAASASGAASCADGDHAPASAVLQMPPRDVVERMSFSEQLALALRVSQAAGEAETDSADAGGEGTPRPRGAAGPEVAPVEASLPSVASFAVEQRTVEEGRLEPSQPPRPGVEPAVEGGSSVLLQLKAAGGCATQGELLEVVLREFTAGEAIAIPEQIRRSLEQIVLRLARENWLLFYEGIALEAQLRARTVAHHCRLRWLGGAPPPARRKVDLEAVLLQLPLFDTEKTCPVPSELLAKGGDAAVEAKKQEGFLAMFLEAWEEHEAWAADLEEHVGPLDLEVSRERSNNLQRGRAHTPYATDLCRLAFRNFAICEGRLFFAFAMAVYGLISRLFEEGRGRGESIELLESLHAMARLYSVQDDALAAQRSTLQEYRYYLLEPLRRACERLVPAWGSRGDGEGDYVEACE